MDKISLTSNNNTLNKLGYSPYSRSTTCSCAYCIACMACMFSPGLYASLYSSNTASSVATTRG